MSEARKYGEQNPSSPIDAVDVFRRAMEEFLWPSAKIVTEERARIVASPAFGLWCSWWQRVACGTLDVESPPQLLRYIVEGLENRAADSLAEGEVIGGLCRLWRQAWTVMIDPNTNPPLPKARSAERGMKFCLIVLVLRYGLASGRVKKAGKRKLPDGQEAERVVDVGLSLQEASGAASHLLALSVLNREGKTKSIGHVPWNEIEKHAKEMAGRRDLTDLIDFRKDGMGLAGFKKRLRVVAPEEWRKVHLLAEEYERQAGKLVAWMKSERLDLWFPALNP